MAKEEKKWNEKKGIERQTERRRINDLFHDDDTSISAWLTRRNRGKGSRVLYPIFHYHDYQFNVQNHTLKKFKSKSPSFDRLYIQILIECDSVKWA